MDFTIRIGNLFIPCPTSRIEEFKRCEFGFIATVRIGQERIEQELTKYQIGRIWESLSTAQQDQLYACGYKVNSLVAFCRRL